MGYKQLKPLDKAQKGERALCLKYVRLAFSPSNDDLIHSKYDSARKNWDASKTKHRDRNFPQGVAVPLYWDYVTTIKGTRENYGHIAVSLDGKIYSNPGKYSGDRNPHIFNSISEIEGFFGLGEYLGWTEDVCDVRVVEYVDDASNATITLPSNEPSWRLYDLGVAPRKGNEKAFLKPAKNGGLEYEILGYEDNGRSAVIETEYFGVGKVYIDVGAIVSDGSGKGNEQSKVGRTFTPRKVPLTLRDAKGVRIGAPSNTVRSYRVLEQNGSLLKIEHPLFDPKQVWVREEDGVIS